MTSLGVARETAPGERRVALVPESVSRLARAGLRVLIERGAGASAGFPDAAYEAAGATLAGDAAAALGANVVARVHRPTPEDAARMQPGAVLICLVGARGDGALASLAARGVTTLALERVPRITRAQGMDVLSSQSTVAGYKAVLLGASALGKFLPMLTTAAGSIPPARIFVIGAGVAGLQAIATARRLGGVVSAFDVRSAAAEQVQSLGATFVAAELVSAEAETTGGYARAQGDEERSRTLAAIARHVVGQDLVITTAQIPGRPAPVLVTEEMVRGMRPGSVIVDLAAETGGNCALSRAGETVVAHGVTIVAPVNLPATVPQHASQMFSRNVENIVAHLVRDDALRVDLADEITAAMCVTHEGVERGGGSGA